jgi:hypothetical protein
VGILKKVGILLLAILGASTATWSQVAQGTVGWSTGYYAGWAQGNYAPSKIYWKAYTHMCHFSITPDGGSGAVKMDMGLSDQSCKNFVAEAKKNHVKTLICVGGAGTGKNFQAASANTDTRAAFIKNIIAFMLKYGYDGVDMDWEEIDGKEASYQALHKELRIELDKISPRPLLTVAMASYIANACGPIHSVFDQMNNMSYWTPANKLANDAFSPLINKGVPKLKMGVGIGFDYEEGNNPEIDCSPEAVKSKCDWTIANGYGGVMVWAIEKDLKKFQSEPSHAMLFKYMPSLITRLHGPSFHGPAQAGLSMTISYPRLSRTAHVEYLIPDGSSNPTIQINMGLFDLHGKLVTELFSGAKSPGSYSLILDSQGGNGLQSGNYVVKLTTPTAVLADKAFIP